MRESSNVELEEELVSLIGTARAYQANIKALKREEEITGSVLDLIAR
jgi:flagellar hook protein FlgE